jgi:hypothetical protein
MISIYCGKEAALAKSIALNKQASTGSTAISWKPSFWCGRTNLLEEQTLTYQVSRRILVTLA